MSVIEIHYYFFSQKAIIYFKLQFNIDILKFKEENQMSKSKIMVPEAKQAMQNFKMEAAREVGVDLKQGYNGDISARQAGSIGGQMVKKMIKAYEDSVK